MCLVDLSWNLAIPLLDKCDVCSKLGIYTGPSIQLLNSSLTKTPEGELRFGHPLYIARSAYFANLLLTLDDSKDD